MIDRRLFVQGMAGVFTGATASKAEAFSQVAADGSQESATYLRLTSALHAELVAQKSAANVDAFSFVRPETFGAKGGDPNFDDSAAIQEMIETIEQHHRGTAVFIPGVTYYVGDAARLRLDPQKVTLMGFGATLNFQNKSFDSALPDSENAGLLVQSAGQNSYYGHASQYIDGLRLQGTVRKGDKTRHGIGIYFKTDMEGFSSRYTLRNFDIHDWDVGVKMGDRAYLVSLLRGDIYSCGTGLHFAGKSKDAGENIRLSMVDIFNSGTGIFNEQAYMHASQCSFDYCMEHLVRLSGGYFHASDCHFERNAGDKAEAYPFSISGDSELLTMGGYIQLNRSPEMPVLKHFAWLENQRSRWICRDTRIWGLKTATDEICGGEGRFTGSMAGIGNKAMSGFVSRDANHNLFAPSATDSTGQLVWDAWAYGGKRTDRFNTSAIAINGDAENLRVEGMASMKIVKTGGTNDAGLVRLFVPLCDRGQFSFEFWYKAATNGAEGVAPFWVTLEWVQLAGYAPDGVPQIARQTGNGIVQVDVPLETGIEKWERLASSTLYDDDSSKDNDGYRPIWATHAAISINLVKTPDSTTLWVVEPTANIL